MKQLYWLFFVGIILLAIVLRFWQLGAVPLGFHADEAAYGYNAYSILKTGRDEYGTFLPLALKSFGDYKAALDSYLAIPFLVVGGLHEWSVRAPSAVFGIIYILLTYLLVLRLSRNPRLALVAMLLATISPVGILLSRVQSDPLICITLFYFAFYFWLRWLDTNNIGYLALIPLFLGLSYFTYTVTRLFSLPFLVLYGCFYWKQFGRRARIIFVVLSTVVLFAVGALYISPAGVWFSQVNVFSTSDVQLPLNEEITEDGSQHVPMGMTRVIHNKTAAYARYLIQNFTDYISFDFLFLQAKQPLREQVPNTGVLMLADFPFLLAGIYFAIRKKVRFGLFAILWVLIVPAVLSVASAETPNIHRFFLAMMPIQILLSLGIISFYEILEKKYRILFTGLVVVFYILNLAYFLHELFVHQPVHTPIYRNDEYSRLVAGMKKLYGSYDVIVSPQILEHILFYFPVDPKVYQNMGSPRDTVNGRFEKFFFVSDPCPSRLNDTHIQALTGHRVLFVDNAQCNNQPGDILISTIRFGNSLPAYYLVEKPGMGK